MWADGPSFTRGWRTASVVCLISRILLYATGDCWRQGDKHARVRPVLRALFSALFQIQIFDVVTVKVKFLSSGVWRTVTRQAVNSISEEVAASNSRVNTCQWNQQPSPFASRCIKALPTADRNTGHCYVGLWFAFQHGRVHAVAYVMCAGGNPGNHITWHPVVWIEPRASCRGRMRVYISKVLFIVVIFGSGRNGGRRIPFSRNCLSLSI